MIGNKYCKKIEFKNQRMFSGFFMLLKIRSWAIHWWRLTQIVNRLFKDSRETGIMKYD